MKERYENICETEDFFIKRAGNSYSYRIMPKHFETDSIYLIRGTWIDGYQVYCDDVKIGYHPKLKEAASKAYTHMRF